MSKTLIGQLNAVNGSHNSPNTLYQLGPDGSHVAFAQTIPVAGTWYLDDDGRDNISTIIGTSGGVGCAAAYDPFGDAVAPAAFGQMCASGSAASSTGNTIWYRDQTRDGSTGNYQLGTRTYNPTDGTFTTPDTYRVSTPGIDLSVGADPVTANTYGYVNGNPVNGFDPTGHLPDWFEDGVDWTKKRGEETWHAVETVADKSRDAGVGFVSGAADVTDLFWMTIVPSGINLRIPTSPLSPLGGIDLDYNHKPVVKDWLFDVTGADPDGEYTKAGNLGSYLTGIGGLLKGAFKAASRKVAERELEKQVRKQALKSAERSTEELGDLSKGTVKSRPRSLTVQEKTSPSLATKTHGAGSSSAAKEAPEGKPFAMGISDHLDDFAGRHGADTWKNLPDPSNWRPGVLQKLSDPGQRVLFNLDGVDVWPGITRAASGRGGATDWELLQLRGGGFPNLEFWQGGARVGNPFE